MKVLGRQQHIKTLSKLLMFSFLAWGIFAVFGAHHVLAEPTGSCSIGTGHRSMAALVVISQWKDYHGVIHRSTNTTVTVTTYPTSSRPSVSYMSPGDWHIEWSVTSRTFRQVWDNCAGYSGSMVYLGYGRTSADTQSGYDRWALDCEFLEQGYYQEFSVTGHGTPTGARSGGTWNTRYFRAPNGAKSSIVITYTQPPKPVNHPPSGYLDSASCGGITGWAYDPDVSGQSIRVAVYISGRYYTTVTANTPRPDVDAALHITGNHGFVISPPSWAKDYSSHAVTVYAIDSTGSPTVQLYNSPRSFGPCKQPPPKRGCPTMPNPNPTISLLNNAPSSGPPPSYGYGTYHEYIPQNKYTINHPSSTQNDISSGGIRLNISVTDNGNRTATIHYAPYINDYPYDYNQAQVSYTNYYNVATYTATGGPHWARNWYCDRWGYQTYTYTWNGVKYTYSWYGCISGHYGPWYVNGYYYVYQGTQYNLTRNDTAPGPLMRPCYERNFTVVQNSSPSVRLTPTQEDPNTVTFNPGLAVKFSLDHGTPPLPLRVPAKAYLWYTAHYYVKAAGSPATQLTRSYDSRRETIGPLSLPPTPQTTTYASPSLQTSVGVRNPQAGDAICFTFSMRDQQGEVNPSGNVVWGYGNFTGTAPKPYCSPHIYNEPYFTVYGNDIGSNGNVSGYSEQGGINQARGASDQLAIIAYGAINGVSSASLRQYAPTSTKGLSFANTSWQPGEFGAHIHIPNYYGTLPSGTPAQYTASMGITGNSGLHDYNITPPGGTLTLYPAWGGGIANGSRIAVYVNGNVYIPQNITFRNANWGTTSQIPSLYIIATGNVYISPNVTTLDGVYVAQHGTIDTCVDSSGHTPGNWYDGCHNQLTVTGAFVANKIDLQRTYASLRNSQAGETAQTSPGPGACTIADPSGNGRTYSCAAEVFKFNPMLYLAQPAITPYGLSNGSTYDDITSLPPVL